MKMSTHKCFQLIQLEDCKKDINLGYRINDDIIEVENKVEELWVFQVVFMYSSMIILTFHVNREINQLTQFG